MWDPTYISGDESNQNDQHDPVSNLVRIVSSQ